MSDLCHFFLYFPQLSDFISNFFHNNPLIIRRFGEVLASVALRAAGVARAHPQPLSGRAAPRVWVLPARAGRGRCCPALAALAPLGGSIGAAGDELAPF